LLFGLRMIERLRKEKFRYGKLFPKEGKEKFRVSFIISPQMIKQINNELKAKSNSCLIQL